MLRADRSPLSLRIVLGAVLFAAGCGKSKPVDRAANGQNPPQEQPAAHRGAAEAPPTPVAATEPQLTTADLWQAAETGNLDDVQIFLKRGVDLAAKNPRGKTALQLALDRGHDEVARVLLRERTSLSLSPAEQKSPLVALAKRGDLRMARLLLDDSEPVDQQDEIERTPLVWAAEKGNKEMVELLLAKGANANHKSRGDWTSLHVAARGGHTEVIDLLMKHNAETLAQTTQGGLPVILAVMAGHYETAERLLGPDGKVPPHPQGGSWLVDAMAAGVVERVRFLAKHSDELEKKVGEVDSTALILAAEAGKTEIVQALLDAGANVNAATNRDWTSLHYAVKNGHAATAQLLVDRGADIKLKNNLDKTPLQMNAEVKLKLP